MDLITLIVGLFFIIFIIKIIISKVVIETLFSIFSNKYSFVVFLLGAYGYIFLPDLFRPFLDELLNLFVGGVFNLFEIFTTFVKLTFQ